MTNGNRQIPIEQPRRYFLKKSELAGGYKAFSSIISEGVLVREKQLQCFYVHRPSGEHRVVVGFAIGKSKGSAVQRNSARRRLREAYRLNKHHLLTDPRYWSGELHIVFMLTKILSQRPEPFSEVNHGMIRILAKLDERLKQTVTTQ